MKAIVSLCILILTFFFLLPEASFAIENPLSIPNNRIGIHILFTSEVEKAHDLVNSNGGDWGYVLIPIQTADRDLQKWQAFMDDCRRDHLIPIIRLASENNYFDTQVWRKPDANDVLDFSNFLNSLDWPTKNKYVVVFNEVNRGDEWGGTPNPAEYAQLLSYAVTAFKGKNPDFFIISAGLDNAAPTTNIYMNEYTFLSQMNQAVPGIFNQVDGIASHSYPNPAFAQPPSVSSQMSINSFSFEKALIDSLASKSLPVFITETGWSQDVVGQQTAASYFLQALNTTWNNPNIVAITPFLLQAGGPPFATFSFLNPSGDPTPLYTAVKNFVKVKGTPALNTAVLAVQADIDNFRVKKFSESHPDTKKIHFAIEFKDFFKWLLRMP